MLFGYFVKCRPAVENAPASGLLLCYDMIFSPEKEELDSTRSSSRKPPRLDSTPLRILQNWNGCLQASLEGHTGPVSSVVFSPNGQQLSLASGDGTVRLWDASTGACLQTLGHTEWLTWWSSRLTASSWRRPRSEEHTSELQSRRELVCR